MGSKKRVVLDLNAKVKVLEVSEKDKLTVKQIVGKFKIGKTQVYVIFKSKSVITHKWLTGNGSMKRKLKETGNEDINEIVWDWFVSARAKKCSVSGPMLQQKAKEVADKLGKKTLFNYWKKVNRYISDKVFCSQCLHSFQ
jgi:hypothetical protein